MAALLVRKQEVLCTFYVCGGPHRGAELTPGPVFPTQGVPRYGRGWGGFRE